MWSCPGQVGTCCLNSVEANQRYTIKGCMILRQDQHKSSPLVWHGNGRGRRVWDKVSVLLDDACFRLQGRANNDSAALAPKPLERKNRHNTLASTRLPRDCAPTAKTLTLRL